MIERLSGLWFHLQASPAFWLLATVAIFRGATIISQRANSVIANPVGISVLVLLLILYVSDTRYAQYFAGARWLNFLLGPATVALAIPLYQQWGRVHAMYLPLCVTLLLGSLFAILSAAGTGWLLGASPESLLSLAPKSATAPVAMGIVEKLGGLASLTAAVVVLTGITGAIIGPWLLDRLRIGNPVIRGFSMGMASHGIGTARAFQESEEAGAFAGLGMGLNALMTSALVPAMVRIAHRFL